MNRRLFFKKVTFFCGYYIFYSYLCNVYANDAAGYRYAGTHIRADKYHRNT